VLPGRLRDVARAAAAGAAPGRLGPAARCGRTLVERRAAGGLHVLRRGRELHAISAVAGADRHVDTGVLVIARFVAGLTQELAAAVAVGDRPDAGHARRG